MIALALSGKRSHPKRCLLVYQSYRIYLALHRDSGPFFWWTKGLFLIASPLLCSTLLRYTPATSTGG